ncbi:unnamed protein product, partial [Polarella glacialis]
QQMLRKRGARGLARLKNYESRTLPAAVEQGPRLRRRTAQAAAGRKGQEGSDAGLSRNAATDALRALLKGCVPNLVGDGMASSHEELVRQLGTQIQLAKVGGVSFSEDPGPDEGGEDKVRGLERALRRCPECRRGRVRVLRLRGPEDLALV